MIYALTRAFIVLISVCKAWSIWGSELMTLTQTRHQEHRLPVPLQKRLSSMWRPDVWRIKQFCPNSTPMLQYFSDHGGGWLSGTLAYFLKSVTCRPTRQIQGEGELNKPCLNINPEKSKKSHQQEAEEETASLHGGDWKCFSLWGLRRLL